MKRFLLFIFLITYSCAIAGVRIDSTYKSIKKFNESEWQKLTKDMKYPSPQNLKTKNNSPIKFSRPSWLKYVAFILIIATLVFLIYKIFKILFSPINKQVKSNITSHENPDEFEEDSSKNLEEYLNNAINSNDYRRAIRYSYLIAIRELALNKLIVKKKDKTNYEYLSEVINHPIFNSFREITHTFEKTWYGELIPLQIEYNQFENNFTHFRSTLTGQTEK